MSTRNALVVVVVVADDMPKGGFTREVMPSTFQHFAQRGVLFANGYAVDPWCAPSRRRSSRASGCTTTAS